ncbi:kinase D-interacting substrate of 220 kDa-like [Ylistrum balloti]|uniref:kinase D-interacting substrate of 220 kDa-like n=1 Tax=Ylistrum balloti TaxID=509963 RepID=UPI002905E46D|nr:kinase D-interacting substrate of 220 kDa-like [Ylistrum balloti]
MGTFKTQLLWESINKGDLTNTINLLENGTINPEERDENGRTFLMLASETGELNIVRELLEYVDTNAVDNDNWSALMCATKGGHLEVVIELCEKDANIEHRDMMGWTALMWACYKGWDEIVSELLDRGANCNIKAEFNMTCLSWAAGRGHTEIVKELLQHGAKVNMADKYGTTPLIWASRKGYLEIVEALLQEGANVDTTGMNSWTALLVATKYGNSEVVSQILEFDPNVNAVDKDGFSALTIAAKEGYIETAHDLLAKGAYVNIADRAGDTILIHAVKSGHVEIVRALLNKYADVDVQGAEGKTATYWAVEKGQVDILRSLLDNNPDLEISTKDEDTPLMRAVRNRNEQCVRLLLDKGAKVSAVDKRGDNALHISLRARSKRITELLLRNPRNGRLLYRSNKSGDTPYNIDAYHQKSILTQIFGHRNLNANDGENLLGYNIYTSALADILSDPALNTPITVGLYAKWGSGKSFLLGKLQSEMKSFTKESVEEHFTPFCWALFFLVFILNTIIGVTIALIWGWQYGLGVCLGLFPLQYFGLGMVYHLAQKYETHVAVLISLSLGRKMLLLKLLLKVLFCIPAQWPQQVNDSHTVKFLFSESTRLVSVGGEKSLAAMVGTLGDVLEQEYGVLVARLFRVFKPSTGKIYTGEFKSLCCIPYFLIVIIVMLCIGVGVTLLVTNGIDNDNTVSVNAAMITFASIVGLSIISNAFTWGKALLALLRSQQSRINQAADKIDVIKMDGLMQKLKYEVTLMTKMVTCMDKFTSGQTRLVVIVDGLDSCEQDKVLQVLDIIKALFSDDDSPFITILAVDPNIIIKGIESNLKLDIHDSNVNGFDYLRNSVHLPFYLQSQGIKIEKQDMAGSPTPGDESPTRTKTYQHQDSVWSSYSSLDGKKRTSSRKDTGSHASNLDITHSLTKNDYFSDINPRSMRRLMNIVAVTGRLLRAYNIDFNWHRLAAWINLIEQWPYRVSWIILYFEENEMLDSSVTLASLYERVVDSMPSSRDIEPLLEIDRNARKLETFLRTGSRSSPILNVGDLKKFLPCAINLDPYLRKLIREMQKNTDLYGQGSPFPVNNPKPGPMAGPMMGPMGGPLAGPVRGQDSQHLQRRQVSRAPGAGLSSYSMDRSLPMAPMPYPSYPGMFHPQAYMGMSYTHPCQNPYTFNSQSMGMDSVDSTMQVKVEGFEEKKLSVLGVEEICDMVSKIKGINNSMFEQYQACIHDNNICGLVLSTCDLGELGKVIHMKFGDWQLFKSAVISMRKREEELLILEEEQLEAMSSSRDVSPEHNLDKTSGDQETMETGVGKIPSETSYQNGKKKSILVTGESVRRKSNPHSMERKKSVQISDDVIFSGYQDQRGMGSYRPSLVKQDSVYSGQSQRYTPSVDSDESNRSKSMLRSDSLAKQMEFETGLLHKAMMHFTEEDLDESEDDDCLLLNSPVKFGLDDSDFTSIESPKKERDPLLKSKTEKQTKNNAVGALSTSVEKLSRLFTSTSSLSLPSSSPSGNPQEFSTTPLLPVGGGSTSTFPNDSVDIVNEMSSQGATSLGAESQLPKDVRTLKESVEAFMASSEDQSPIELAHKGSIQFKPCRSDEHLMEIEDKESNV